MQTPTSPALPAGLWQNDDCLRRAGELLDQCAGTLRAVSFDFFDTLVWRLTAKPTDVFFEVGHRLQDASQLPAHVTPADWEVFRRVGEGKARERQMLRDKSREDITLTNIYEPLKSITPNTATDIELQAERELCLLNPVMIEFARHARQRGLKLLIVSDIYLSAEQLRSILRANHLAPELFDFVFTSSETGVCKWTGNLFQHVLKATGLKPEEILHLGDNFHADVGGARKAGIRACNYVQAPPDHHTILDRERFLLGAAVPNFSINSLRLLAARNFPGASDDAFFARAGAFLLGPLLTRFATWACDQFVAAGVRKVGAFMREGEILGALLQAEAAARGLDLEITPLYVNRKSTDLAALGRLSADNLIDWLERRQTLSVKKILEHFGLRGTELHGLPLPMEEKADSSERILQLAKYLFTPEIASRIEARSAEERRKVIDYLKPWLSNGTALGLCDIGYNASAQMQLQRILDLENDTTRLIGCYLVTCERAASRVLDGLDVRHFLGAFGNPGFNNFAFLRSPAFVEQSLVAATGTTLGYERQANGTVTPVLDAMRFPDELLRHQRAFKDGIRFYQQLWLHFRATKPGVLDGTTDFSRRLLAGIDAAAATILARATAFPLRTELAHFGSLPLDDYYFAEGVKRICGPKERELARTKGFAKLLTEQGVLWPQAVHQLEHPRANSDFFSYARGMLHCDATPDADGTHPELTVVLQISRHQGQLRECLARLTAGASRDLQWELLLLTEKDERETAAIAGEFTRDLRRMRIIERQPQQTPTQLLNATMDGAAAPYLMILDDSVRLSPAWDAGLLAQLATAPRRAIVYPTVQPQTRSPRAAHENHALDSIGRCYLVRRLAFVESLGLQPELSPTAAAGQMLRQLHTLGWTSARSTDVTATLHGTPAWPVTDADHRFFKKQDPEAFSNPLRWIDETVPQPPAPTSESLVIDWVGSFLDHGSLSHVNRELSTAVATASGLTVQRISNGAPAVPAFKNLAGQLAAKPSAQATVTVRHAWPPDWRRPPAGKLVVIQPWEFGSLPSDWVEQAKHVDEFWLPSEYVRQVYAESGVPLTKLAVVPNGVDLAKFKPEATPMSLATQKQFKFLFVGGTIFRKGPDVLLKAYLANFTAADDVCLVIKDFGGQSVYAGQTFEQQIRTAQAQPNAPEILYLNQELPPEALPGLYTACDCLVLPYRGEGFGLPVLEAMACGRPVIVTQGGATEDFVRDAFAWRVPAQRVAIGDAVSGMKLAGTGWLWEPDVAALGQAMRAAQANPNATRERGRRAYGHARESASWHHAAAIATQRIRALIAAPVSPAPSAATPRPAAKSAPLTLPECALVGHLGSARALLRQRQARQAWEATLAALSLRPFHPEAYLLLAEIAATVGAGDVARRCAEQARRLAPGLKDAKKLLNPRGKGSAPEWMQLPESVRATDPTPPRLSVCLIVKNEEKFLDRCLQSIRNVASQIVVVDTGSTDRTVAIAKAHSAEVYNFTWCDDFSAARNVALAHATGDWVLVLDADEELSPESAPQLATALQTPHVMAWRLPIVDVGREAEGCSYVPRLFRNAPALFYVGRIHEQVFTSIEVRRTEWQLENQLGDVTLIHHGYTAEMTRDRNKVERNLRLLERAIAELPDEPHLLMNLGLELARSGRETAALEKYQEAFAILAAKPEAEIVPELRETLLTQLVTRLTSGNRWAEVIQTLRTPLAQLHGGLTASLHFSLGLAHLELKQFGEAAEQMRQCLAKRNERSLSPLNRDIHSAAPHHCLALALARTGATAAAQAAFEAGLSETAHGGALRIDYARFLAEHDQPVPALERLHEVIASEGGNVAAWRLGGQIALGRAEFLEFARDWTGEALRHCGEDRLLRQQRAEALLLSGDTTAALELWETVWRTEEKPAALAALIICQLVETHTSHAPRGAVEENATSRAFLAWYQKLIAANAGATIARLNECVERLGRTLPTAAQALEGALREVEASEPATA